MQCGASAERAQGLAICRRCSGENSFLALLRGAAASSSQQSFFRKLSLPPSFSSGKQGYSTNKQQHSSPLHVLPDHFWTSLSSLLERHWGETSKLHNCPKKQQHPGEQTPITLWTVVMSRQGTCCLSRCSKSCSFSIYGFFSLNGSPSSTGKKSSSPVFLLC